MNKNLLLLREILWLSLFYVVLLIIWGYSYGKENSLQLIPYAEYLNDRSLFTKDFFIQNADKNFPNERSFFMYLLLPLGGALEWGVFILHYLCSLFLLLGLFRISFHILQNRIYAYASLIILMVPLQYHTLGLNELYGNEFISSFAAVAFAVWSIYFWLNKKVNACYLLLIFSTLMHPLAGLQTFLLISATSFIISIADKDPKGFFRKNSIPLLLYFLTAGSFIFLLNRRFNDTAIDSDSFFHIFFVFRNAHHYIPSAFVTKDLIILTPLYLITPFLIYRYNKPLFIFSVLIITGCLIYTIFVELFKSAFFAETQWFKTTYYLEFFMVVSGLLFIQRIIPGMKEVRVSKFFLGGIMVCCIGWVLVIFPGIEVSKNDIAYEFPFYKKITPEIDIAMKAKDVTPKDALFIQPCSLDELKHYGQRSGYIDYKGITHSKSFIVEWSNRFREIYSIDAITSKVISFDAVKLADENYKALSEDDILKLKADKGITHMIAPVEIQLSFKPLASNSAYTIYEL
ncbi:MAG: DUF6798 domain-containing protein [Chitinophagales bacterium]